MAHDHRGPDCITASLPSLLVLGRPSSLLEDRAVQWEEQGPGAEYQSCHSSWQSLRVHMAVSTWPLTGQSQLVATHHVIVTIMGRGLCTPAMSPPTLVRFHPPIFKDVNLTSTMSSCLWKPTHSQRQGPRR